MRRCFELIAVVFASVAHGFVSAPSWGPHAAEQTRRVRVATSWHRGRASAKVRESRGRVVVSAGDLNELSAGLVALQAGAVFAASVVGFGDALIVIPLMAICYDVGPEVGAPLVSVVSLVMFSSNLMIDWLTGRSQAVGRWRESLVLGLGAALGVPVGVAALVAVDTRLVRAAIATFLILFGAYKLSRDDARSTQEYDLLRTVLPCGIASGVLGGVLSAPGPPAVILSRIAKWDSVTTRIMLFRFFLPVQILATVGFWRAGLITSLVLNQALHALPAVALAILAGTYVNRRINTEDFDSLIAVLLVTLGLLSFLSLAR